jgi:hypothetical protein
MTVMYFVVHGSLSSLHQGEEKGGSLLKSLLETALKGGVEGTPRQSLLPLPYNNTGGSRGINSAAELFALEL